MKAEFNDPAFYKKLCDIVSHRLYSHEHLSDFKNLSQEVMLQSCLEFLIMLVEEHNLTFSPGEKTETLFRELSESFSISEIMNFIYSAVKNAAAYYMKGNVSKKQAANSIVGSIQRRAENTIQENWEVKKFRRNYDLPQSTLERVLYTKVFKGDDKAFDLSLNRQVELLE
ncbi:MAG: hypothetical protein PF440_05810 [Thiomicrorhabdus sp.]|nr:hypothetical protein [Thiomicrorhabdus sp.]